MRTLERNGLTRRTALMALTLTMLAFFSLLILPTDATSACCGRERDVTYYSDDTKTTVIGECYFNDSCSGQTNCWGSTSSYTTSTTFCCEICVQ
jgi:hypothetical protein